MCWNIRIDSNSQIFNEIRATLFTDQFFKTLYRDQYGSFINPPKRDCNGNLIHYNNKKPMEK